ncbi:MAG: YgiT-type zinc finger protein [candidate division NC10 bacterium]|nr:YgiT-type zinc finger protein [candidate division NC10 bacterium]MDE2320617.1 YgiT-type zinc finger protein [candidate division NC10 bacterium]
MFTCHVCGHTAARSEFMSEVFMIDGRRVLVEHIPTQVCQRCGEATFSRETTEKIRQLVRGVGQPIKTVPLEVFALA